MNKQLNSCPVDSVCNEICVSSHFSMYVGLVDILSNIILHAGLCLFTE